MAGFSTAVSHRLGQEEAMKRMLSFLDQVQVQQANVLKDMRGQWNNNTLTFAFKAMGMAIGGTMRVDEQEVVTEGELPFAASFFRGKIEQTIRDEMSRVLQ